MSSMGSLPTMGTVMETLAAQVTRLLLVMLVIVLDLVQTKHEQNHGEHPVSLIEIRHSHGELQELRILQVMV